MRPWWWGRQGGREGGRMESGEEVGNIHFQKSKIKSCQIMLETTTANQKFKVLLVGIALVCSYLRNAQGIKGKTWGSTR